MSSLHLNYHQKGLLFRRLASLQKAGIDIQKALNSLSNDNEKRLRQACLLAANKISAGKPFHQAAKEVGLIDNIETGLIRIAYESGNTDQLYAALASQYEQRARHAKKIKARMIFPVTILILSGFITPLPSLVLGDISIGTYLYKGLSYAAFILILLKLIYVFPQWFRKMSQKDHPLATIIDTFILKMPLLGSWYIKKNISTWLEMAGLSLRSGLSAFDTMSLLHASVTCRPIKHAFISTEQRLRDGQTFTQAISHNPYIDDQSRQFISSGESAGKLDEMLTHAATLKKQSLQLTEDSFSEWFPRLVYFIIIAIMVSNIFQFNIVPAL